MESRFPNLFKDTIWEWGNAEASFRLLDTLPPAHLISNVNIVGYRDGKWLIVQLRDGDWEIPGGTMELGESYLQTLERELMEEAGARMTSECRLVGAWKCHSLDETPFRPHLPHPDYYRVIVSGEVEIVGKPTGTEDGEQIISVELVSLDRIERCFRATDRPDLAELYQLAALLNSGEL